MNNRKPEIFIKLLPETKGKHLPKQKIQHIFFCSLKTIPPHPSCPKQGAALQAGHREVAAGCGSA